MKAKNNKFINLSLNDNDLYINVDEISSFGTYIDEVKEIIHGVKQYYDSEDEDMFKSWLTTPKYITHPVKRYFVIIKGQPGKIIITDKKYSEIKNLLV